MSSMSVLGKSKLKVGMHTTEREFVEMSDR